MREWKCKTDILITLALVKCTELETERQVHVIMPTEKNVK